MLIGYARVSSEDQNLELQLTTLKKVGCRRIFTDKISGVNADRPGIKEALSHLRETDTLVVWKLDRLGRSVKSLVERTRAGLEVAKRQGRVGGRKRRMTEGKVKAAKKLLSAGTPLRDVAQSLGVSVPTLYRWVPASARM
jgi:DNA invertase Pin-like site-specific DNA recombinase